MHRAEDAVVNGEHRGVVVPMVTPFTEDERVDEAAVRRIIDHLLEGGVAGVLLLGTTGEAASMGTSQRRRLIEAAVQHVAGRVTIYAGISHNSYAESIGAARIYRAIGVDALVAHLPTAYPLGVAHMHAWFERLASEAPGPLLLYNIPMTTRMSIPVETVEALSTHPNIAGIKDSEYDVARMEMLLTRFKHRTDFAYFVGPSVLAMKGLGLGADGFVPGVGNVMPDVCQRLMACAETGDWAGAEEAQALMNRIGDTYQTGRTVTEAVGRLKAAMKALGLCSPVVLPPLLPTGEAERTTVAAAVAELVGRKSGRA